MYRHGVGGYPTERPVLMHTWNTFTVHLRQRFGQRVQKIPLDAGASCPNRDGTLSRAGCTFCNAIGSGSGLGLAGMNLPAQWEHWRKHFRKSNAFEISKRLGLDEGVIDRARTYLKGEDVHFEDIISSAQSRYQLAEEERAMASAARRDLDKLRQETEAERRKLEADRAKYQAKAKDEARRIVEDTRREMDKLIADIRSIKGVDRSAADRVIQQSRDALRKRRDDLAEKLVLNKEDGTKPPKTVNPGDTVRIVSLDKKATVLSKPDSKGEVQVQAGVMKLNAKLADLRMMQDDTPQKGVGKIRLEKDRQVGMELDIRGMLVDDAILVVDRYIDNAVLSGLTEINIIHGKGTGALRAGIQDYLRTNKRVKSFRLGNYGEGDAGVTVVTLKETKQ